MQELVDGLAASLSRAVLLEDARLRLIAYSQTDDAPDPVRLRSILRRESPDDVRVWLFEHGLQELREPTVLPAVDALGMGERVCCPVRHAGALLGYLWVVGGGPAALAGAGPVADALGELLHRRRLTQTGERAQEIAALRDALAAGGGPVGVVRGGDVAELEQALRRATGGAGGRCFPDEDGAVVLAGATGAQLRVALQAGTAPRGLGDTLSCARRAALVAELLGVGDLLTVDDVPLEAHVLRAAGDDPARIVVPAIATAFLAAVTPELARTVQVHLDLGGDVAASTAALSISRAGLYRRLQRMHDLAGVDLHDGAQRTLLHIGLTAARLRLGQPVADLLRQDR